MRYGKTLLGFVAIGIWMVSWQSSNVLAQRVEKKAVDNMIEATMSQSFDHTLIGNKGDFVLTSTAFQFDTEGLSYTANTEKKQRAVLMRTACGDRWVATFEMLWVSGKQIGAGLYFSYENMMTHFYVGIDGQNIYLIRNGNVMAKVRFQAQPNKWMRFRLRRQANQFKVWVDNFLRLEYEEVKPVRDDSVVERDPLPYGGFALGTDGFIEEGAKVIFRNLKIQGNVSKKPLKHAYVETINLQRGSKNTIIWLHQMDDRASQRVRVFAKALQVMEKISGLPYPVTISSEVSSLDYKAPYPFRKSGQSFFPDVNIILSGDKTQEFLTALAEQWDYFQELWLAGGYPLFLAGAASQSMSDQPFIFKNVLAFQRALTKMTDKNFQDFAVDGVYFGPEDVYRQVVQGKEFYAEKGALFLYMIYRDLGEKLFAKASARAVENLSGKEFKRSKYINSEDFLEAIVEITQTRYKPYFNGWIFPGKYDRWSPDFFIDEDKDGLLLFEEKIIGTSDKEVDTDKDGYSDAWEYLNGFDPKDSKKPNVAQIAVDGFVLDWANFRNVASVLDPVNDVKKSFNPFDVRKVMMRGDDKFVYIGVQYHNDIRLNTKHIKHRLSFTFNGKAYHAATIDYENNEFIAQRLQGKDLWYDFFALDQGFLCEFAFDMECRIPISFFDGASRIELSYSGPGEIAGGKVDLNIDPVLPIEVFRHERSGIIEFITLNGLQNELWGFGVEEVKDSGHTGENLPQRSVDLRQDSYWEAKHNGDWVLFQLDKVAKAKSVILSLDSNIQYQLWVEISRNQKEWITVVKDQDVTARIGKRVIPLQKMEQFKEEFQYIRIHILKTTFSRGAKLFEISFEP